MLEMYRNVRIEILAEILCFCILAKDGTGVSQIWYLKRCGHCRHCCKLQCAIVSVLLVLLQFFVAPEQGQLFDDRFAATILRGCDREARVPR